MRSRAARTCGTPAGNVAESAGIGMLGRQANRRPAIIAIRRLRVGQIWNFEQTDVISIAPGLAKTASPIKIRVVDDSS